MWDFEIVMTIWTSQNRCILYVQILVFNHAMKVFDYAKLTECAFYIISMYIIIEIQNFNSKKGNTIDYGESMNDQLLGTPVIHVLIWNIHFLDRDQDRDVLIFSSLQHYSLYTSFYCLTPSHPPPNTKKRIKIYDHWRRRSCPSVNWPNTLVWPRRARRNLQWQAQWERSWIQYWH